MGRVLKISCVIVTLLLAFVLLPSRKSEAVVKNVPVSYGDTAKVSANVGDAGTIHPNTKLAITEWIFSSSNDAVVRVDPTKGTYTCIATGHAEIMVQGYDFSGSYIFVGYCDIDVNPNMENVRLSRSAITGIKANGDIYTAQIAIKGATSAELDNATLSFTSTNTKMGLSCWINDTNLYVSASSGGKSTLTVTIGGKVFVINVNITEIAINKTSVVLKKGGKVTLKVNGTKKKASWTTSNKKVATISKKGVVKAKKVGNVIIKGKLGDAYFASVISVVKSKMTKVIKRAKYIGGNWKYSQPKRMTEGFYDCSSLVWKSYSLANIKFGNKNYAPVAAELAKYIKSNGKVLTNKYTKKQVQSLKFRPGDLMFEPGAKNGRYKGIYHVEMFVGYAISDIDDNGNVSVCEKWAARPDGCYGGGYIMERPKY
ncbi:Ig-like domain-containing protein [Eubacterium xylanophilum]|uniref:Ig-like domain-containing protein n=1 Tax=Eubacterium xylanophilum TaxID=39497 RepID=UPI00047E5F22|nr:Ig-like domain-containing protein [Eubacterium xylanophilum]